MQTPPKLILVPVTLDDDVEQALARRALETAVMMAGAFGSRLHLLHVCPDLERPAGLPDASTDTYEVYRQLLDARRAHAQAQLESLAGELAKGEIEVEVEIELVPNHDGVAEEICHAAERANADLVTLSSHSRTGVRRAFLGSVAEKVAHLSCRPVLVLPSGNAD